MFGQSGQYGYFDGIILNEISATDYALSDAELLAKYPYVDSVQGLKSLYFESRRYNLIYNGNAEKGVEGWIPNYGTVIVENGKLKVTATTSSFGCYQIIKVKKNTDYYLSGNASSASGYLRAFGESPVGVPLGTSNSGGPFNSGNYETIYVWLYVTGAGVSSYFDSIMLVEGTSTPSVYKSCEIERFTLDAELWDDEIIEIKDGRVSGLLNWKHRVLYGKDYDWMFDNDMIGYKSIKIPKYLGAYHSYPHYMIKYDGKPLLISGDLTSSDMCLPNYSTTGYTHLTVHDKDSGWAESVNPNADEVKAFMNGWKALLNNGTRYTLWRSVICADQSTDLSAYPNGTATKIAVSVSSGATSITVQDASIFKQGDSIALIGATNAVLISSISGSMINLNDAIQVNVGTGIVVAKVDTGIVNYCKNNVAPNYPGYQLHYKLSNPEPVTDINVPVHGKLWSLVQGDNYVIVDSGVVLGEAVNPGLNVDYYVINKTDVVAGGLLGNKCNKIIDVFRNSINDTYKWSKSSNQYAFGLECAYIDKSKFDINATYTINYRRLYEEAPQIAGELYLEFKQDIVSSVKNVTKAIGCKQKADSALDRIVDLSLFEELNNLYYYGRLNTLGCGVMTLYFEIPIVVKKVIPQVTLKLSEVSTFNGSTNIPVPLSDCVLRANQIKTNFLQINLQYIGSDATMKSYLKDNGAYFLCNIALDCRGRI